MSKNQTTKIGVLVKPHGLKGDIVLKLDSGLAAELKRFDRCYLHLHGSEVPFVVNQLAPLNAEKLKITLHGIDDVNKAEQFRGVEVSLPAEWVPQSHGVDWQGYEVYNGQKLIGTVTELVEETAQPMLAVETAQGEVLIPLVADFIASQDAKTRKLHLNLPEGLLEL